MASYVVQSGDTLDNISRKQYGTENASDLIARSNPGLKEPLTPGTIITVDDATPTNKQPVTANVADEVAVLIDNNRFRFWDKIRIHRSIDAMDTVEFGAPFDANAPNFKKAFVPFSFKSIVVTVGGKPLFTGTMIGVNPIVEPMKKAIEVSGYSKPGVLNDCTAPASAFPLEFNNQTLQQIATELVSTFGITVEIQAEQGAPFERVACEPGRKILSFLADLAKQRNLIISSSPNGALVFLQSSSSGSPIALMRQGEPPILNITPFFNPQEYYSHITGIEPVVIGTAGSQYTVKNPKLPGVTRPITFPASDTLEADVKSAVDAKAGRMFGNMASYSIEVATWRTPEGELWQPNTTIKLIAPDAMIYKEYEFLIRHIEFNRDSVSETATLDLVIPGSFSGKIPESLPWDV